MRVTVTFLVLLLATSFVQPMGDKKEKTEQAPPRRAVDDYVYEDGVLALEGHQIDLARTKIPHLLVEYYAPWCKICEGFAPEYQKLAGLLKRIYPDIKVAKVNCELYELDCKFNGATGFPHINFYKNGFEHNYKGMPKKKEVMDFIDKVFHPYEKISTYAKLHHRRKTYEHSIVYVGRKTDKYFSWFEDYVKKNPDFKFLHYFEENSKFLSLDTPQFLLKNDDSDSLNIILDGKSTKEGVFEDIQTLRYPRVKKFQDAKIAEMIFERNQPALIFVVDNDEQMQSFKPLLDRIDQETLRIAPVVWYIKANIPKPERFLNYFGIKTYPFLVYMKQIELGKMTKHFFKGKFNYEEMIQFARDAIQGKLKQDYKSEPIPKKDDKPVLTLVGDNFRDYVKSENNVIVTYVTEPCQICDEFWPQYYETAQEAKDQGIELLFTRVNYTENETGVGVMGFPTIKLYKKGKHDKPIDFSDKERTKHQLVTFLKKEGFEVKQKTTGNTQETPKPKSS
jgi:protein disulfide isomerase